VTVIVALAAALCYAVAAAFEQHQAATDTGGSAGLLRRLVRRPMWLAGFAAGGLGAGLHLLALATGPLTTVQPIGVFVVVFAVPIGALLRRRRPQLVDLLAATAVSVGLAVLVSTLSTSDKVVAPSGTGLCWTGLLALLVWVAARRGGPVVLAGGAAVLLGSTSALVRALASTGHGVGAFLHVGTLLLVACVVAGTTLEQRSYRVGRLGATVAVMTVVDPIASIGLGSLLLGQPVSIHYPALTVLAAPVVILGVAVLARHHQQVASPADVVYREPVSA
jgi:drug/metabolite transporter (DMT)-like permease